MLALQRRQQRPPYSETSCTSSLPPSPPNNESQFLDHLSQQIYPQKLLYEYLQGLQQHPVIVDDELPSDSSQFMTGPHDLSNPAIRIQQSTPTPQPSNFQQQPMLANSWTSFGDNGQLGSQSLQTPGQNGAGRGHQRASSSSSIGSNGSQYQAVNTPTGYSSFQNNLPTPTHTPTQDSFMNNHNFYNNTNNYAPNTSGLEPAMSAHNLMKQAVMDNGPEDEVPGFGHSARHSVSSYGRDSPATPRTQHGEEFEDRAKGACNDTRSVPRFERTFTDAASDQLLNPGMLAHMSQPAQATVPSNAALLSPWNGNNHSAMRAALKAAEDARSRSPSSAVSRGVSPFRSGSPYVAPSNGFSSPLKTAQQVREEQQAAEADGYAMRSMAEESNAQPRTVSPKDVSLEYHATEEDAKMPLFPEGGASEYDDQYNGGGGNQYSDATQSSYDTTSAQKLRQDNNNHNNSWASAPQNFPSNFSASSSGPSPPQASFNFVSPSIAGNLHGLPSYATSQYRSTPNMTSAPEPTPEFPAHLTSMESSASEQNGPGSSQVSNETVQRPAVTNADSGTYTCTYHNCTMRFETPQKLQKHKREGHRSHHPTTSSVGGGITSAALLERNSQAGPHKCNRINPTTGKPCATIFSRPYDLTRHEDTIHNARKQKVRCALCVEEKTFSRNDALTRHMRVCHPDVDFPGKHKRRGGSHD